MTNTSSELGAKLLANEDISVIRARVSTASFDIKNRVLTLPQWKDLTPTVEGMLIGHEVGHALYTTDDYLEPLKDNYKLKGYLNILEDVRIEKLMKRKYPGIRKTMNIGYKELNDKDFFGVKKVQDFNLLSLIDRINLYFKAGYQCGVKFDSEEKQFVIRAEHTETIDEVVALGEEIYKYSLDKAIERKKKAHETNPTDLEDLEDELEDSEFDEYDDESATYDSSDQDDEGDLIEDDGGDISKWRAGRSIPTKTVEEKIEEEAEKEIEAKTDTAFEDKLKELADEGTEYRYFKLDERDPIINPVVGYKTVLSETAVVEEYFTAQDKVELDKFKVDSTRVVNYLIKEFEMRKSASMYKRAQTSKIGSLDMKKIWGYQLNDDLFKRVTVVQKGKNHGMLFLLDWSGSMDGVIDDTVRQVINLAMFCQRAQIPYQVFAFTTQYDLCKNEYDHGKIVAKRQEFFSSEGILGNAVNGDFAMLEFFSSKMSNVEFNLMIRRLFNVRRLGYANGYSMGGTPLNEALSYMVGYIPKFMKNHNVEKMSLITLTDGEGGSLSSSNGRYLDDQALDTSNGSYRRIKVKNFLKDPKTKKDYEIDRSGTTQTEAILRLIKDRYDVNSVGFYICQNGRYSLTSAVKNNLPGFNGNFDGMVENMRKEFKENGFASLKNTGRDDLFIVPQNKLVFEDKDIVVEEKQSARQIARMFTKQMSGQRTSRVLLNKFIGYVA